MSDDRSRAFLHASRFPRGLAALASIVFLGVLIRTGWIGDDAMISWRTVLNVTHGFGLTFNIAERVQTFTHPLWLLLLTGTYLISGNIYYATFVLSFVVSVAVFWLAITRAASGAQGWVVAVVLLFSRAFVDYSTSGLENPLSHLLIVWLVVTAIRHDRDQTQGLTRLWLIASLLYLTRPDLVLFAVPFLAMTAIQTRPFSRTWRAGLTGLLPALAWTVFSLIYYGFPFPNTAYAKLGAGISKGALWNQGIVYLVDSLDKDPLTLVVIAFGVLVGLTTRRPAARRLTMAIVIYVIYVISIGGDFMGGRFLSTPLVAATLLVGWLATRTVPFWLTTAGVLALVGTTATHVPLYSDSHFDDAAIRATGITDERGIFFKERSLARATRQTLRSPGWPKATGAPRPPDGVNRICGLLGADGMDRGPYQHIIDECALADPLLSHLPAIFNDDWRIGHFRRMVPAGYEESVAANDNQLTDPQLHAYYDAVRLITRSPDLFSAHRLRAILRMNLGRYEPLVNVRFYRHNGRLEDLNAFSHITPEGTPAADPGTHDLKDPIAITCDDMRGRRYIDISADSDDSYKLTFLKGPAVIADLWIFPVPEYRRHPGLAGHPLELPPAATQRGFDTIVVEAIKGDEHYTMGHLLIEGNPVTDADLYRRREQFHEPVAPR